MTRFWIYHSTKGIVFWKPDKRHLGTPQCNANVEIAEDIRIRLYPWAELRYVPSVFRRINPHDYA